MTRKESGVLDGAGDEDLGGALVGVGGGGHTPGVYRCLGIAV